jgi:flagellar secretion chaperone FliS
MNLAHYAQAYRRNAILSAGPGQLILMLFDGALRFMNAAVAGFDEPHPIRRNEKIHNNLTRTQAILTELQDCLDLKKGGDFAQRMFALYKFMRLQLRQANLRKDPAPIHVVIKLLGDIRQSWADMLMQNANGSQDAASSAGAAITSAA